MSPVRAVAAALLIGSVALVPSAGPARAAPPEKSGWWYRAKTATPTAESPQALPAGNPDVPTIPAGPPTVSDDQLHVESTPAGPMAIAALTFRLAEGEASPVLTFTPASGSIASPVQAVVACRAAISWVAPDASPGRWEDRPLADCTTPVEPQVLEGGALSFALQPLLRGTDLDIVIVPLSGSTVALTFDRPGPDALQTTAGGSSSNAGFEPTFIPGEGFDIEPEVPIDPVLTVPEDLAMFGGFMAPPAPVVLPDLQPGGQQRPVSRPGAPRLATAGDIDDAARTLGLVMLVLGAVAAYMTSVDQTSDVMGLGRFRRARHLATPTSGSAGGMGGLGRLRRPRAGKPPSL